MPELVGVRFKPCGKVYDFEIDGFEVRPGDSVVVESDFGLSIGTVIREKRAVEASEQQFRKVLRIATEDDFSVRDNNRGLEKEARDFCVERIMARGLPMKLVACESTLDRRRIMFFFTADGRIDFRELVKDLASRFKTRIEMRQIGIRDEAKMIGGLGICGRELCCRTFLTGFEPISIKMAKKQELVLNVGKLSGLCGRLMCCLKYEYEGDTAAIITDDEVPVGQEEEPVVVLEEKLTAPVPEKSRGRRPRVTEAPPAEPAVQPPPAAAAREEGPAAGDQEPKRKKRSRGRRRRFKNEQK